MIINETGLDVKEIPRVVFGFLKKSVKERFRGFYVIRNKKDIVTHVPPVFLFSKHVGRVITIGSGGYGWIDAHRPENYLESLTAQRVEGMRKRR